MRRIRVLVTSLTIVASTVSFIPESSATSKINNNNVTLMKELRKPAVRRAMHKWLVQVSFAKWLEGLAVPACGGDLPPCYVMYRESKGNMYAVNPGHRGAPYGDPGDPWTHASGKWQFMPRTWNNYMGYPYAAAAPALVQNAKAREVWANGRGASHWAETV